MAFPSSTISSAANGRRPRGAVWGRRLLARALARFQHTDPVQPADVILVLAGGHGNRERHAAALYHQGLAPRVLITRAIIQPQGHCLELATLVRQNLEQAGVPPAAIECLPTRVRTTYDEARLFRRRAQAVGWRRVIIVTDPLHTRRARATFRRVLHPHGVTVMLTAAAGARIRPDSATEKKLFALGQEALKFLYYTIRGRLAR